MKTCFATLLYVLTLLPTTSSSSIIYVYLLCSKQVNLDKYNEYQVPNIDLDRLIILKGVLYMQPKTRDLEQVCIAFEVVCLGHAA